MARDELYEKATTLQDMLDNAHKHPSHLIEVLENAVQYQPFLCMLIVSHLLERRTVFTIRVWEQYTSKNCKKEGTTLGTHLAHHPCT